jgi:hypothetical protein
VGDELSDFRFSHFFGMLFVVKENKAPDPAYISALRAQTEVFDADYISHLIQQFRRWHNLKGD